MPHSYDQLGRKASDTLPDGGIVSYHYFPTGELKDTSGARTYSVSYTYDSQGRMKTMLAGSGTTTWNYDPARGWLTGKLYNDGTGPSYTYTPAGRLLTRAWARGITTTYGHDGAGSLTSVTYSDGVTPNVTYSLDRVGRLASVSDAAGTRALSYKDDGQPSTESFTAGMFSGMSITSGYDSLLRRNSFQVQTSGSSMVQQSFGYDAASRMATATEGDHAATYGYVANSGLVGQVTFSHASSAVMTTSKAYDNLNRLTSIANVLASGSTVASTSYTYNAANERTEAKLADGGSWKYDYDTLGQVTGGSRRLSDGTRLEGEQFGYTFDGIGNRLQTTTNGRVSTYTPNALNQYTQRTVPGAADILGTASPAATVTVNKQPVARQGGYWHFQLTADNTAGPILAPVDIVAAVTSGSANTVTETLGHSYVAQTPEVFQYDLDGNLTQDGRWNYTWDGENRLIEMSPIAGVPAGGRKQLAFAYDYQSRRISKSVSVWNAASGTYDQSAVLEFVYDGWNLGAELSGSGSLVRKYLWGLDLSGTPQGAGGVGGLLAETDVAAASTVFPAFDGSGNLAQAIKQDHGTVAADYEFGPCGEILTKAEGAFANPMRFSGKYSDVEAGLVYYGFRYHSSALGRCLTRDPIAESGGLNIYTLDDNDPVNWVDICGLSKLDLNYELYYTADEMQDIGDRLNDPANLIAQTDLAALIRQMRRAVGRYDPNGKCGNCIHQLVLSGEGTSGAGGVIIWSETTFTRAIGADMLRAAQVEPKYAAWLARFDNVLAAIRPLLCKDATVYFLNCFAGAGRDGDRLLHYLDLRLGNGVAHLPLGKASFSFGNPSSDGGFKSTPR